MHGVRPAGGPPCRSAPGGRFVPARGASYRSACRSRVTGSEPLAYLVKQVAEFPADDHPLAVRFGDQRLPRAAQDDLYVRVFLAEPLQPQRRVQQNLAVNDGQRALLLRGAGLLGHGNFALLGRCLLPVIGGPPIDLTVWKAGSLREGTLRRIARRSEERRVGKECRSRWSP